MIKGTCTIEGCDGQIDTRGLCPGHYGRFLKWGDPQHGGVLIRRGTSTEERFWLKVNKSGPIPDADPRLGNCWMWTAALKAEGYGHFRTPPGYSYAHRYAYELLVGPIPDGLQLDHLCRNRACVRPEHLDPVTQMENLRRGETFVHWSKQTHCRNGHPYSGDNLLHRTIPNGHVVRKCAKCSGTPRRKTPAAGNVS
jgi:HNH endonuclease